MGFKGTIDYVLPGAAWGACATCRTADQPWYALADTENWEGDIIICKACAETLAGYAGFVPARKVLEAEEALRAAEDARAEAITKAAKFDELIGDIENARRTKASDTGGGEPKAKARTKKAPAKKPAKAESGGG